MQYSGLTRVTKVSVSGGAGTGRARDRRNGEFGTAVTFKLPKSVRSVSARHLLGVCAPDEKTKEPEKALLHLIEERARELPLPDGAVVIPPKEQHEEPWADVLSALAVLTKSSGAVWLRTKTPRLSVLKGRRQVSLLVPPSFAARLMETTR